MARAKRQPDFDSLSIDEKILHVQELWDRIAESAPDLVLTPAERAELDRRLEAHRKHPEDAVSWEEALRRIRRRK